MTHLEQGILSATEPVHSRKALTRGSSTQHLYIPFLWQLLTLAVRVVSLKDIPQHSYLKLQAAVSEQPLIAGKVVNMWSA